MDKIIINIPREMIQSSATPHSKFHAPPTHTVFGTIGRSHNLLIPAPSLIFQTPCNESDQGTVVAICGSQK